MRVLLINIDSKKVPNLALEKCAKYHLDRGDEVVWDYPLLCNQVDKIYVSCVFSENRKEAEKYEVYANTLIGGSGYNKKVKLPAEIESVKPRINQGYTTRGCFRRCAWCIVPAKEGGTVEIVGDLLDLWDGKKRLVTLFDNNILAKPEHFIKVCSDSIANRLTLDFNQGLDHRLLTPDIVRVMARTKHKKQWRFAYDRPSMAGSVDKAINMLEAGGINKNMWYVLVDFNTTFKDDLARLNHLRNRGQIAYVQRFDGGSPEHIPLARWANQRHVFVGMTFGQFLKHEKKKDYYTRIYGSEQYKELTSV
jgi:hypothetical protein